MFLLAAERGGAAECGDVKGVRVGSSYGWAAKAGVREGLQVCATKERTCGWERARRVSESKRLVAAVECCC